MHLLFINRGNLNHLRSWYTKLKWHTCVGLWGMRFLAMSHIHFSSPLLIISNQWAFIPANVSISLRQSAKFPISTVSELWYLLPFVDLVNIFYLFFFLHFIVTFISSKILGCFSKPWLPSVATPSLTNIEAFFFLLLYSLSVYEVAMLINYQPLGLLTEHKPWGWGMKRMVLHKWARFGCSYQSCLGIFHQENVGFLQKKQLTGACQYQHVVVSKQKNDPSVLMLSKHHVSLFHRILWFSF